jgi:UDP-glucuronate decarboxylase
MTHLVTGGAGFLGSHLCDRLLEAGNAVICVDNLSSGSYNNIKHLENNPDFRFIEADVESNYTESISEKLAGVWNLACPASPPYYQADPVKTMMTCVLGAKNALELAKKNSCKAFEASTSEVYGDPNIFPQPESYRGNVNPIGIRACYDEGKRAAETLFFDYHRSHGVDIKVVRIFNTYGPRMDINDGRVVSNFIAQALQGKPLTVYGDGSQTRSFCYVDDLIDGFCKFFDIDDNTVTGPVNLGRPGEMSVLELAERVKKLTVSNSEIVYKPLPSDDPLRREPDITYASRLFGFAPRFDVDTGLKNAIEYFKTVV